MEQWKWIKDFENVYEISNFGRLKSYKKYKDGYILSKRNCKGDYLSVILSNPHTNKKRYTRLHILVAEAFIGEIPKGYHVHHKDDNKQNNCVDNLEIIHPRKHRKETEKTHPQIITGMNNYNKFIRPKHIIQRDMDDNFIAEYANAEIASRLTGVCQRNILQVANKTPYNEKGLIRSQAGGYKWEIKESEVI